MTTEDAGPVVVELGPLDTHALRWSVLRDGTASDAVEFDGDEVASTFHLGIRLGDDVVAISTWVPRPYPDRPRRRAVQVRGMATVPPHRGAGYGAMVLAAGLRRCRHEGVELVWARARETALTFYERHGFTVVGPSYIDATTGLPHRDILLELG